MNQALDRHPTRRRFLQLATACTVQGFACFAAPRLHAAPDDTLVDYMDGYHGGIEGHMPQGSWRDILNALQAFPDWCISLDIEPRSWAVLQRDDPESFALLHRALLDASGRVEMVGGTFAQPYGWAMLGESNIRQLHLGLQHIKQAFPGCPVVNYVTQEPCWASCLPQILRGFGFTGASLKNPSTAWGGYFRGYDAEIVDWTGPDGSSVRAVPRYAVERLQHVWETESIDATPEFAQRCHAHGIAHPAGMCLQDLGWAAKPRILASNVHFQTWRQYFAQTQNTKARAWRVTPEDILVTLPWGDATLRAVAQQVRSAECRVVQAEKLATAAWLTTRATYAEQALDEAWQNVLLAQAHDAWITATTRTARDAWAFQVATRTLVAQNLADEVIADALVALASVRVKTESPQQGATESTATTVLVCNSLASSRRELVRIPFTMDPGAYSVEALDAQGRPLLTQVDVERSYVALPKLETLARSHDVLFPAKEGERGLNQADVWVQVDVPAFGFSTVQLRASPQPQPHAGGGTQAHRQTDGTWVLESDFHRIVVDTAAGGTIRSWRYKPLDAELLDSTGARRLGECRGYFIEEGAWRSSREGTASITCEQNGPLRVVLRIDSTVGSTTLTTRVTLGQGDPQLRVRVSMHWSKPTYIGDPYVPAEGERMKDARRSQHDGSYKLQFLLPFVRPQLPYKSAAFDVCRSEVRDTTFQRWDDIRHNIVAQWLDFPLGDGSLGVALLSDHTTAYHFAPGEPPGLVLAWAWDGSFWWGKHAAEDTHQVEFALLPHRGTWSDARLWREYARFCEPLQVAPCPAFPANAPALRSLIDAGNTGLELSSAQVVDGELHVRFFHAHGTATEHILFFGVPLASARIIDFRSLTLQELQVVAAGADQCRVRLHAVPFALVNLRCTLA